MSKIINLCGNYPEGFVKQDILSDPNYVFIPDPNFTPVVLFNEAGNAIQTNSFVECEHYATGGWEYSLNYQNELSTYNVFSIGLTILILIYIVTDKIFRNKINEK